MKDKKKILLWTWMAYVHTKIEKMYVYYTVFPLGVLYPEHLKLGIFDCVVIACSLESIRPGLVCIYKAPNGVG